MSCSLRRLNPFASLVVSKRNVLHDAVQSGIILAERMVQPMAVRSANVNARIDPEIKTQGAAILKILGVSESTFIDMAYRQLILHNGIPFPVIIPGKVITREDMTEEEFGAMLTKGIQQAKSGESLPLDEAMDGILKRLV